MITVQNQTVTVITQTLCAVFENGTLVSLKNKAGREFLSPAAADSSALDMVYRHGEVVPIRNTRSGSIRAVSLAPDCAEIRFDAWDGSGVITITEDPETGDLCVEPEVTSARYGILAARFTLCGIVPELRLAAPFYQGIDLPLEDELLNHRKWIWPHNWEAGLAILHDGGTGGFWVHTEDSSYRCKSLTVNGEQRGLSFDSEAWGPVERSLSAGGLVWRINVFDGGWEVPAARYRDWLWEAYRLNREESRRIPWTKEVRMAVSWCPTDAKLLDALAARVDPKTVLLHLPNWRKANYDQCYPDYTPSDRFTEFMRYAEGMGFRCMPHANSIDMDPSMPEYRYVQDFKFRDVERGVFLGWGYEAGKVLGVPSANPALNEGRSRNVMVKVHPGLALWRSILAENIDAALAKLDYATDCIFIDVTLCTYNLDNCLVDNTTDIEGMKRLIAHVEGIRGGLAVGGEGLNEITMQNLTFAQAHLFDSHQGTRPGLERCGGCALNDFLFGRLCRTMGYSNLGGATEDQVLRERIHEEHHAIPTITVSRAEQIEHPNAEIERILRLAAE